MLETAGRVPDARQYAHTAVRLGRWGVAIVAAIMFVHLLAPPTALAASCDNWTNKAGGSWNTPGNWSEGVPTSSSEVCITKAGTYEITLEPTGSASVQVKTLKIGASSGTQKLAVIATSATNGAYLSASEEVNITAGGTVALTSTGSYASRLESSKLKNAGTITAEAGAGGERSLAGAVANTGALKVATGVSLDLGGGSTFTNGSGGSVVGTGSGHLLVDSGTFIEGAGTTSGSEPVVSESGGTVEYAGTGASSIIARSYYTYLKGNIAAGQTFTIEGNCNATTTYVDTASNITNAGTINLTTSGCPAHAYLKSESGNTLTNTGTIKAEAGAGGDLHLEGAFVNKGAVEVAAGALLYGSGTFANEGTVHAANGGTLQFASGTFTNGSGGSVVGTGSGHLLVDSGTFIEGAGTTSGSEPVVSESGGTVEYAGTGASSIIARSYYTYLKGNIAAGQTFTIEGNCNATTTYVDTASNITNAGTINLTTSGCPAHAYLKSESGNTLTNTGTIKAEAGAGGDLHLEGAFVNKGAVEVAAGALLYGSGTFANEGTVHAANGGTLQFASGTFTNGSGGSVVGTGSGHLLVDSGTFIEGAGTTSGSEPVVSESGGTVEYAGTGASSIIARSYYTYLKGNIAAGQTFTIEGNCNATTTYVDTASNITNAGTINLTTSGCPAHAYLKSESGNTLTNTGTIKAEAGAGGDLHLEGAFVNDGAAKLSDGATLTLNSGTFTNGTGGSVVGSGSGHIVAYDSGTFIEGAGTTSGPEPVVSEDGTVEYTGTGASNIIAREYNNELKGNLAPGQTYTIEANCEYSYAHVYAPANITNGGTIALTSSGCKHEAALELASEKTLTNTGTIKTETGEEGTLRLRGTILNTGATTLANNTELTLDSGTFTNGTGGSVAGTGSGHIVAYDSGTFIEGAGTTSGPEPVVSEDGTVEYTGTGASNIIAREYGNDLKGNLSPGQTYTIEANCAYSYAHVYAPANITNGGTIALTSSGCKHEAALELASEKTLTNTGTIKTETGEEGTLRLRGTILNTGATTLANNTELTLDSGTFTNGTGGSVAGTGSGHIVAYDSGTFIEGAGTTSGPEPVVSEDGTVEYTGTGASNIIAREYGNDLKGNLSPGQTYTIEANCAYSYAHVYAPANITNGGTIALTSSGCEHEALLQLASEKTLSNTGTIKTETGSGGALRLYGNTLNTGTIALAAGVPLALEGEYTQGKAGKLKTAIASSSSYGALAVDGLAVLGGTLEVDPIGSFKASSAQKFAILTDTTRQGDFEFEKGGAIGGGLYYRPVYAIGGVTLEATEAPPEGLPVNTALPRIFGLPKQGQTLVLTHGTWTHSPFEYTDKWQRCNLSGEACQTVGSGDSYVLTKGDAGHTMRVQETATDSSGEGASALSAATNEVTVLELRADAGEDLTVVAGQPVSLDGSGSTPASEIEAYRWEFGDKTTEEVTAPSVSHTYAEATPAGKPDIATLTVKHKGESSAPATVNVTVLPAPSAAEALTVTVLGSESQPLIDADVVFVGADGTRTEARTDSSGHALLAGLPSGVDTVYAYAPEYQPAIAQVSIDTSHHGTATVSLSKGEIATTKLKAHEMTLAEIEAAGIDPSDPANNNVYEFELRLAFIDSPTPAVELHGSVNGEGEFVGGYGGSGGGGGGGGGAGGGWECLPTQCEYTPPVAGPPSEYHIVAHPVMVENHPLIEWLIMKGKATVLKQFFEVSMVIQNLSPEPFKLSAGQATLNVPEGMSLAPTPEPQSASQSVAAIPGEGSAVTNWIIRGDKPGSYALSADYEAALQPFNAPFTAQAALAEPLRVWGREALKLKVEGDEQGLTEGVPWSFALGVTNEANVPLYNVELAIDEEPHANFDFQPGQQFAEMLGELKPQQTVFVKRPYVVVPDANSVSVFNPELSSATFVGEPVHPGEGITAVKPLLPIYEKGASAIQDTPGAVHLHWQSVPGAEGYEVFSAPQLTTAFNDKPDEVSSAPDGTKVTTLPASARDAYATPVGGEARWYAISAIIEGQPVLELNTVHAAPLEGHTPPEFGRCVAASSSKEGSKTVYHGDYTKSSCAEPSATHSGKYEWEADVAKSGFTTASSGVVKFETASKGLLSCKAESGSGSLTGANNVGGVAMTFTGCESAGQKCTTGGRVAGELATAPLEGILGWEDKASKKVALDLYPANHAGPFIEYRCGSTPATLSGSLLVPLKVDKMVSTEKLKYKASKGKQKPEGFEGAAPDVLENGLAEQVGVSATATLAYEEAVEINAVT